MALLTIKDDLPEQRPDPIRIQSPVYRGVTVDSTYQPSSALLLWVEGSNWTVDYYSQVLGADSEPMPQAVDKAAPYQQYRKIEGMDLKVTTPLGFSQDPTTKIFTSRGNAITFPFLIPNQGDMFIADIGDGTSGLFTVINPTRATILRDSVYNIEYELVERLSETRLADLREKTIQTLLFSRDSLMMGCGPFLTEEQSSLIGVYEQYLHQLLSMWLGDFYSPEHQTVLVPDQDAKTYDHYIVKLIHTLFNTTDHPRLRKTRQLNVSAERILREPTVWEALVERDDGYLSWCIQKTLLLSTRFFRGRPELQALGYTGIPYVVFPQEPPGDVESQYSWEDRVLRHGQPLSPGLKRRRRILKQDNEIDLFDPWYVTTLAADGIDPSLIPADIKPVADDPYYVFSKEFYFQTSGEQSKLELLARQLLNHESLNHTQLRSVLSRATQWENLERFYYYPVLFVLLKQAIRER